MYTSLEELQKLNSNERNKVTKIILSNNVHEYINNDLLHDVDFYIKFENLESLLIKIYEPAKFNYGKLAKLRNLHTLYIYTYIDNGVRIYPYLNNIAYYEDSLMFFMSDIFTECNTKNHDNCTICKLKQIFNSTNIKYLNILHFIENNNNICDNLPNSIEHIKINFFGFASFTNKHINLCNLPCGLLTLNIKIPKNKENNNFENDLIKIGSNTLKVKLPHNCELNILS
jgi:hypothetical protein